MEMNDDLLSALVQEAALEYFPPEQIAEHLSMPLETVQRMLSLPGVQARVAAVRRQIIEDGSKFSTLAKRIANECLPEIARIIQDSSASPQDKLKAFEHVVKFSGLAPKDDRREAAVVINLQAIMQDADQRLATLLREGPALPPVN